MDQIKPRGELRRLRTFAAPHDLNNEALRLPKREPYKMHQQTLVPIEQLVSNVDGIFSWCAPHEVGNLLMYARYRALSVWSRDRAVKRNARILANQEAQRIAGKTPAKSGLSHRSAVSALWSELMAWEVGQAGFLDAIHHGQVLVAIRRRELARGKLVAV